MYLTTFLPQFELTLLDCWRHLPRSFETKAQTGVHISEQRRMRLPKLSSHALVRWQSHLHSY